MKLQRSSVSPPAAATTGRCSMSAVCRRWRALDSCGGCPRAPRGTAAPAAAAPSAPAPILAAAPDRLRWSVRHDLPRRLRLRLEAPVIRASAEAVEGCALAVPGVSAARFTPETGSLLVEHDGAASTRNALLGAMGRLSAEVASATSGVARRPRAGGPPPVVREVLISLFTAALPPLPAAAFKFVRAFAAADE